MAGTAVSGRKVQQDAAVAETKAHYEATPFAFFALDDEADLEKTYLPLFRRFVEELPARARVLEVGCGPGRCLVYGRRFGHTWMGFDLTRPGLRHIRAHLPEQPLVQASALQLPVREGSFDGVMADGVIHHTPDPHGCVREMSRALKPGAQLLIAVYTDTGHYPFAYQRVGAIFRAIGRLGLGFTLWPLIGLYGMAHGLRRGRLLSPRGAKNLFYDYFMTPIATFHGRAEVEAWGRNCGLEPVAYDGDTGYTVHHYLMRKVATSAP